MLNKIISFFVGIFMTISGWFGFASPPAPEISATPTPMVSVTISPSPTTTPSTSPGTSTVSPSPTPVVSDNLPNGSAWLTKLPLGDNKYVTNSPKKGYVYLCNVASGGGGAQTAGPWIDTANKTWDFSKKIHVLGNVAWPNASVSIKLSGSNRNIISNSLPLKDTSGVFPIQSSDPAYVYDRNPNTISAQNLSYTLPAYPVAASTPACIYGEVGIMVNGMALFDGFDAGYRDAAAWEVQDHCDAHPQSSGLYHYHSLSGCLKTIAVFDVIGFAFDGYPITGPKLNNGNYLKTADLDECHGLTSTVNLDGKQIKTYHYVMTQDFPYSVSCFKGKSYEPHPGGGGGAQPSGSPGPNQGGGNGAPPTPPQEAINACSGKTTGASCSFTTPNGNVSGICDTPPNTSSLACVPR